MTAEEFDRFLADLMPSHGADSWCWYQCSDNVIRVDYSGPRNNHIEERIVGAMPAWIQVVFKALHETAATPAIPHRGGFRFL